jgi:hypothetical protein
MSHADDVAAKQAAFLKAAQELEQVESAPAATTPVAQSQTSVLDEVDDVQVAQESAAAAKVSASTVKVLDRKRSFGTVMPADGERRYQQDGVFFDHFGNEVV